MRKEFLKEKFKNASDEYCTFQIAMLDAFKEDPIMDCLIGNMNKLADAYYMAMIDVYQNGYTLEDILRDE